MDESHDANGREYAKLSELKTGEFVEVDGGFDCMFQSKHEVFADDKGLYVICDEGSHYLEGQCDNGTHLVGIYKVQS